MKKLLLSFVAMMFAMVVKAQTVITFDASVDKSGSTAASAQTLTKDGITLSITNGILGTNDNQYRIYKSQTLTVSSTVGNIVSIEFTCTANNDSQYGPGGFAELTGYTYDGKIGTWVGNAAEVTFEALNSQVRATKIVVTVGGEAPAVAKPQASVKSGTYIETFDVELTAAEGLIYYQIDGEGYEEYATPIHIDNTCKLETYAQVGQDQSEVAVYEYKIVTIDGTGEGTVESPYDVERALSLIENDVVSSQKVYVAGTITQIDEISTQYGNATYLIGQGEQTLKIYRGYGLNGEKFTAEDELKVGDVVVVYGQLVTGYGGQITTGSSLYSINGNTYTEPETPPYEAVGDGSKENPYTVEDIVGMNIQESDGNKYWVKGYILGSASSATKLNDADKAVDTNIALGATADATTFIPVAIPAGDLREILGVAAHPENVGKEVMVYGTLEKYFLTAGVKNVEEAVITEDSALVGDVNCDGVVDVTDLNLIIDVICGEKVEAVTDVNNDNVTDVTDLNVVIDIICGV